MTYQSLHINNKRDFQLSLDYDEGKERLEVLRLERIRTRKHWLRVYKIPIIRTYFVNRARTAKQAHREQFKKTRAIFQESDEYKKTRGF